MSRKQRDHGEWTDRISDYIEGDLAPESRAAMETQLAECGACRRALEDVRAVISAAGTLGELEPPRDLWGGIAATIGAPTASAPIDDKVIEFPAGRTARDDVRSGTGEALRVAFSMPQLVAACVALVAASSLATWVALPGQGGAPVGVAAPSAGVGPASMVSTAVPQQQPPAALAEELATLERTLVEAREVLDPNTVRILERNLSVIEQAIEDSRQALAQDPENEFLAAHLERVYERKLSYLREAARVAEWST
jgi:hypothetical protein